ncbi:MAG: protein translocase subunit SecF, partial [Steroidobacteraceae bacterium]|nr:protein translocase subunit SecF [Steroidobacteraceae bacterium]MDW8260183.1 protein translocase subunit SecF [Gammaproteobacteria bacterium]
MEFFKANTRFAFMATRRIWYAVSALLIAGSLLLLAVRGLNLGIDFTGGTTIEVSFPSEPDLDAIRRGLERAGYAEPIVQNFGTTRDVAIRLPPPDAQRSSAEMRAAVETVALQINPQAQLRRVEVVGPQVGAELRSSAIWSMIFTIFFIFIYVLIRFHNWRLPLGAILAVLHDPLLVLGFFALTQITFDLSVVAAILAVIGYSLNDTVVVFDRIRERFQIDKRAAPEQVLDRSINQTLSRTIMTSVTTLLVVV